MRTYTFVYFLAAFVALLATPTVIALARKARLLDAPGTRKVHKESLPRIGGLAILLAVMLPTLLVLLLDNVVSATLRQQWIQLWALLVGGGAIFLVGLTDDGRGLRARHKLLAQLLCALAVCASGNVFRQIDLGGGLVLHLGPAAWPVTVLWIVGLVNAVNLIDGLDGLAGGIAAIAAAVLAAYALQVGDPSTAVILLALAGALTGFLFLNFNPASIFMGDCGSMFLGFLLAGCSVMLQSRTGSAAGFAMPLLVLGVPILDTAFSMGRRVLERRSPFSPDRGHIHHRLLARGLSQRQTVLTLHAVTAACAGLGYAMIRMDPNLWPLPAAAGLLLLIAFFRAAGAVRLKDALASLRAARHAGHAARQQREHLEEAMTLLREARTFDQWWLALCTAAAEMNVTRVALDLTRRDGTRTEMTWAAPAEPFPPSGGIHLTVPLRDRRAGSAPRAVIDIPVNGSLEVAGRAAAHFGRLLDEYGLAALAQAHPAVERPAAEGKRTAQPPPDARTPQSPPGPDRPAPEPTAEGPA